MATRPYGVRLVVDNGEKFEQDFDKAGRAGETAMKRISEASRRADGDLKVFNGEVGEAADGIEDLDRKSKSAAERAGQLGKAIGTLVGAGIAAFLGLALAAKSAVDGISAIGDAADRAGVDVDLYEKTAAALTQVGESSDNLEDNFRTLTKRIGDARAETGKAARDFKALGVDLDNADGSAKSTSKIMEDLADAFARVDDKAVKSSAAQNLFGESGGALVTVLEKGSAGLREMAEEADRLGLLYGGELIRRAQDINAEFAIQAQIIDVQLKSALIEAAPLIRDLTNEFIAILPEIIAATHSLLAFLGLIEKPIRLQLAEAEAQFETFNRNRVQNIQILQKNVGVDPRDPGFDEALAKVGGFNTILAGQVKNLDKSLDETEDKIFRLKAQIAELEKPPAATPPSGTGFGSGAPASRSRAEGDGAFDKAVAAAEKQIAALQFENQTRDLAAEAIARQRLELALLAAAEEEFGAITPQIRAEIDRLTASLEEETRVRRAAKEAVDAQKQAERDAAAAMKQYQSDIKSGIRSITDEFLAAENGAKSWEQAIFSVILKILELKSVSDGLGTLFDGMFNGGQSSSGGGGGGGGLGSFFGILASSLFNPAAPSSSPLPLPRPSARGDAFETGARIVPFRSGGVVRERARFDFLGGTGEMAEEGPEAIAPLGRNARGELGIKIVNPDPARGAAPQQVNIYTNDPNTRVTFGPSRAQGARRVRSFSSRAVV